MKTPLPKKSQGLLIWNPLAGRRNHRREAEVAAAKRILESSGFSIELQQTNREGEGAEAARNAVTTGVDLVIVCGGDGTINDVLAGLVHSQVPLAILPGGTANVLARELGLPLDIASAARLIPKSAPQRISLGKVNGRHFILMAGIGFDASVVRGVDSRLKKVFGMATYIVQAFRQLIKEPLHPFELVGDGRKRCVTFACISRARYYGPFKLIPEANLLSDRFFVYCFSSSSRLRYLWYSAALMTNLQSRLPDFEGFSAQALECASVPANGHRTYLQVDGEFAGELPCEVSVAHKALTLMIPPTMYRE